MKPTLLFLFSIIFALSVNAQDPQIEWQNTIGGSSDDFLSSIQQTADGGYIVGGMSHSGISGDKTEANWDTSEFYVDYWIIKLDPAGNIEWQNTIGGSRDDELESIQQTADGGFILGGQSTSGISGDKTEDNKGTSIIQITGDFWIIKLNAAGNIIWQNTIGGIEDEWLNSIQQTSDGGYILGGYSDSGISGDKTEASQGYFDYWVVKLDTGGNIIWQNTIGGRDDDFLESIQQTTDGGFILGGWSDSGISGDKTEDSFNNDYWVVKLDETGNIVWQNTIRGNDDDRLYSIQQTVDGGYILGGFSNSGISGDKTEASQSGYDYWVIKLDATGNIYWQNTIGGSTHDYLYSVQQTTDRGYILGGWSNSGISGDKTEDPIGSIGFTDYWIIKLDALGNIIWQNTIGGNSWDDLYSIQQTTDDGYILGGWSHSEISGDKAEVSNGHYDFWVVKLRDLPNISGQILTETGTPIAGVTVTLSGDDNRTYLTNTTGRYNFMVAQDGTYTVTPSKSNDSIPNNGVTLIDVLLMRRHLLGMGDLPSPYKIIAAAEVNAEGDTTITTQDILFTRSLILGNITSFPTNRLWQFVSSDYVFPYNNHPFRFPTTRTYTNINTNQTNQNFIGIKLGDVNGSWDPNVH